jgi:DNA-binding response OmpR family regulator
MSEAAIDILLVEDEDGDAEMILRSLRKAMPGVCVHRLRDGEEAIEFLRGMGVSTERRPAPPKLMLLDVKMPHTDGIDVLRRVKASDRQGIHIVMLTQTSDDHTVLESRRIGAHGYLIKPVAVDTLRRVLQEAGLGEIASDQD